MSIMAIVLRIGVLVLSLFAFVPQIYRIWSKQDSSGISLHYALLNSMVFIEHFTRGLHFIANNIAFEDSIVGSPPTPENWLDLFQFGVVCYSYLMLFTLCLYYPPHCRGTKYTVLAIHALFFIIALLPVIIESYLPLDGSSRRSLATSITNLHQSFITPFITILCIASLFPQARETFSCSSLRALSIKGLATQAVIFTAVAVYWPFRIKISANSWSFITWYQLVGWATVDNAVFAIAQAILLSIAIRRGNRVKEIAVDGEGAPLLRDETLAGGSLTI